MIAEIGIIIAGNRRNVFPEPERKIPQGEWSVSDLLMMLMPGGIWGGNILKLTAGAYSSEITPGGSSVILILRK